MLHFMKNIIKKRNRRGFTLAELVVTIAIFSVLTTVVLANYHQFIKNADFANSSESLRTAIREAQVYGVATKKNTVSCGGVSTFDCAFGVYIPNSSGIFTLFADANNNKIYDTGEKISDVVFPVGTTVSTVVCPAGGCPAGVNITFRRPNPDALISNNSGTAYTDVSITLTNGTKTSVITVFTSGQISLQ